MKLAKCPKNHFYDADLFQSCPHCQAMGESGADEVTHAYAPANPVVTDWIPKDEKVTIDVGSEGFDVKPAVGWLVCVSGKHRGMSYVLNSGFNFISRSDGSEIGRTVNVILDGESTVSRDIHAAIVYDQNANKFFATPGYSTAISYVNGSSVLVPVELKKNDVIRVGEVEMMFVPFCDSGFKW